MVSVRRIREAVKPRSTLADLIADLTRTRDEIEWKNAALRQKVILLSRGVRKPKSRAFDRVVLVLASVRTATRRDAVLVVNPDTVLRWHRQGFRLLWAHKSRKKAKPPRCGDSFIERNMDGAAASGDHAVRCMCHRDHQRPRRQFRRRVRAGREGRWDAGREDAPLPEPWSEHR